MQIRLQVPARPRLLEGMLEGLCAVNYALMRKRPYPPLYSSGIRYEREGRAGPERWLIAPQLVKKKRGDCEDLAAYRCAELRMKGEPARVRVVRTGNKTLHAVVQRADGRIEDPSRRLGMGRRK